MTVQTWLQDLLRPLLKEIIDEGNTVLMADIRQEISDLQANVGAMFQTVSKDVTDTAGTISTDIQAVSGAVEKSTLDTISGVAQAIADIPQQILNRLPHIPGFP